MASCRSWCMRLPSLAAADRAICRCSAGCGTPSPQRGAPAQSGRRRPSRARRRRWPRCTPRPTSCSAAGRPRSSSLLSASAGLPGRGQQVGLVVRAVPDRVPRLPAGVGQRTAARSRSSASTARTRNQAAAAFLQQVPGHAIRATPIRTRAIARTHSGGDLLPADGLLRPAGQDRVRPRRPVR